MTLLSPYWLVIMALLIIAAYRLSHLASFGSWRTVLPKQILQYFGHAQSDKRRRWNPSLLLAAAVALVLTAPSLRVNSHETFQQSNGWLAVVDVSRSMTLTDIAPSRLSAVRNALLNLSKISEAYPLGLIVYAGDAFLVTPPAFDKRLFNEQVALLEHGIVPIQGSNLARALSLSEAIIQDSAFISARIFVFSDGGGISKASISASRHLAELGHRVDLILTGSSIDGKTPIDTEAVEEFLIAGNGDWTKATAMGAIDIDKLSPEDWASADSQSRFEALIWENQSHWFMLLLLPWVMWLLRDDFV